MVRSIYCDTAAQHKNPVPNAAMHRGLLVTSGILGKDPKTDQYFDDIEQQFSSVFSQLEAIMSQAGGTVQDVVKVDLYMANKQNRPLANRYWEKLWPDPQQRPARQAHQADLPPGCVVQIVATAVLDPLRPAQATP